MGPFGSLIILPMLPELRTAFTTSTEAISWGFSAYMFPMAAFLLISGTIGERHGRGLVLRASFGLFVVASLLTAFAPNLGFFLVGRALQGVCNAFFTPLLLASLTDASGPDILGRRIGIYSSFQAAGGAMAPLVGGIAGDTNWRYAFIGTAVVSFLLAVGTKSSSSTRPVTTASFRSLVRPKVMFIGLAAFFAAAGPYGAAVLVGLKARDIFELSATTAGLVILGGSVSGLLVAPSWGWLLDRQGPRRMSSLVMAGTFVSLSCVGFANSAIVLTLTWIVTGAFIVGIVVALQGLAATAVPENRAGALSATMSFRFFGHALGPIIWVPVFTNHATSAFVGAAALGLIGAVSLWAASGMTTASPSPAPL